MVVLVVVVVVMVVVVVVVVVVVFFSPPTVRDPVSLRSHTSAGCGHSEAFVLVARSHG